MLNIGALNGDLRTPVAERVGGGVGIYELNGVLIRGLTIGGAFVRVGGARG